MSDEPVNKLYGNKIKLDFTKLGNKSQKETSTTVELIRKVVFTMTHLPLRTLLNYTVIIFNIIQNKC